MNLDTMYARANAALIDRCPALFVALPAQLDDLLGDVVTTVQRQVPAQQVTLMHLLSLKQTALAVRLLLGAGFPVQAMDLSANMMELAYELLYLRDAPDRLQAWHAHTEPGTNHRPKADRNFKDRMLDGLEAAGIDDLVATHDADYERYRLLCNAQHASPTTLKVTGGVVMEDTLIMGPQAYSTTPDWYTAVLTMSTVAGMAVLGAEAAVRYQLQGDPHLLKQIKDCSVAGKIAVNTCQTLVDQMK